MVREGSVIKYNKGFGKSVLGEVKEVIKEGQVYLLVNDVEVLDKEILATYHKEQRVW